MAPTTNKSTLPNIPSGSGLHAAVSTDVVPSGSSSRSSRKGVERFSPEVLERIQRGAQNFRCYLCGYSPCRCLPGHGLNQPPWNKNADDAIIAQSVSTILAALPAATRAEKVTLLYQVALSKKKLGSKDGIEIARLTALPDAQLADLVGNYRFAVLAEERRQTQKITISTTVVEQDDA